MSVEQARVLTESRELANYFETCVAQGAATKLAANWIMGDFSAAMNRNELDICDAPVSAEALANIISKVDDGTLSSTMAKQVFDAVWNGQGDADTIIETRGLKQVTDSNAIEALVDDVIAANSDQVAQFREGKTKVLGFLVGQVMKQSKGQANPKQVNALMRDKLSQ